MQKDSALLLVKSPNLYNEYTRHGAAHIIRGLPIRVVYPGVWRYLQEYAEGSPLSLNSHCKHSKLAVRGELL